MASGISIPPALRPLSAFGNDLSGLAPWAQGLLFSRLERLLGARWFTYVGTRLVPAGQPAAPLSSTDRATLGQRTWVLAADPAHGLDPTPGSLEEAAVGLAAERHRILGGPIVREASGMAEFVDTAGQLWDVKSPRSPGPADPWRFDLFNQLETIKKDLGHNNRILLNLTQCNARDQALLLAALPARLSPAELANIVVVR